jgi:hypothetical protein
VVDVVCDLLASVKLFQRDIPAGRERLHEQSAVDQSPSILLVRLQDLCEITVTLFACDIWTLHCGCVV